MATLTWHGHSCFSLITDEGTRLLFDPFLDSNPVADIESKEIEELDFILVSHGHSDHFEDCIPLATRTGAKVISTFELVTFCLGQGVENGHAMNVGGSHDFPFGKVKLTPAIHSGSIAGDEPSAHTTACCGFLIHFRNGLRLYFAGDTALTRDMELLRGEVDVALLPIGDNYTMGPSDAVKAVGFIEPSLVIPMHYNTWELIAQDADAFARQVGDRAEVRILTPGASTQL